MTLQIWVVKSDRSEAPLAEIRTDGKNLEFMADNTNGRLPKLVQKSFDKLRALVNRSSHLMLEQHDKPIANLLSFVLSNGDIAEITTDGRTCMLNGTLLSDEEKEALFQAIQSGEISVSRKADSRPEPVFPMPISAPKLALPKIKPPIDQNMVQSFEDRRKQEEKARQQATHNYDPLIEKMNFSDMISPELTKQLAYGLIHGRVKGESDA